MGCGSFHHWGTSRDKRLDWELVPRGGGTTSRRRSFADLRERVGACGLTRGAMCVGADLPAPVGQHQGFELDAWSYKEPAEGDEERYDMCMQQCVNGRSEANAAHKSYWVDQKQYPGCARSRWQQHPSGWCLPEHGRLGEIRPLN